jgi:tRNA pseudouridine55 synthase
MHLGIGTDTQDHTGQVVSRAAGLTVTEDQVCSVFRRFLELKEQIPPAFSALKHHGAPLYKLARRGDFVRKPPRQICVYELELLDMDLPSVRFRVSCSQGTYVRTLCADIGEALGCGAHLAQLCRTESGGFALGEAMPLSTLREQVMAGRASDRIIPMSQALRRVPEVKASPALAERIRHGRPVTRADLRRLGDPSSPWIKVTDEESTLIAVLGAEESNGTYPYACVLPKERP